MAKRLTKSEISAIIEALECRLAGEIEEDQPEMQPREAYESASAKI